MSYLPMPRPVSVYTPLDSGAVKLSIRQQPHHALVTHEHKEKGRKPIDPPPIVQMHVDATHDPHEFWLVNPFLFMMAMLIDAKTEQLVGNNGMIGQNVSSLHRLKDLDSKDAGFFVFGDISVRKTGTYKLQFNLYDYDKHSNSTLLIDSITSSEFKVCSTKDFKGLAESTQLSRHFSDQGVRLRLRKEPRAVSGTKRAWNSSPTEPTTPAAHAGLYGGPVHAHNAYNMPPLKRQRSNEDYPGAYLYQQQSYPVRPSSYGASFGSDGSTHGWNGGQDSTKAYTTDHNTGLMTPGGHPHSSMNAWPRAGIPLGSSYGATGGPVGSTPNAANYFSKPGSYMTPSAPQQQHSAFPQPPSLPSQGYAAGASSLRSSTSENAYPSNITGLHTPTSLSDHVLSSNSASGGNGGSGQAGAGGPYMATGQTDASRQAGGSGMAHFTGRGLTLEQPVGGLGGGPDYLF